MSSCRAASVAAMMLLLVLLAAVAAPVASQDTSGCGDNCEYCAILPPGSVDLASWATDWILRTAAGGGETPSDTSIACVTNCFHSIFMTLDNPASVQRLVVGGCGLTNEVDVASDLIVDGALEVDVNGVINAVSGALRSGSMNVSPGGVVDVGTLVTAIVSGGSTVWGDLVLGGVMSTDSIKVYADGLVSLLGGSYLSVEQQATISGLLNIGSGMNVLDVLLKSGGTMDVFTSGIINIEDLLQLVGGNLRNFGTLQTQSMAMEPSSQLTSTGGSTTVTTTASVNGTLALTSGSTMTTGGMTVGTMGAVMLDETSQLVVADSPLDIDGTLDVLGQLLAAIFNVGQSGVLNFLSGTVGSYEVLNAAGLVNFFSDTAHAFTDALDVVGAVNSNGHLSLGALKLGLGGIMTISSAADTYITEGMLTAGDFSRLDVAGNLRGPNAQLMGMGNKASFLQGSEVSFLQFASVGETVLAGKSSFTRSSFAESAVTTVAEGSTAQLGIVQNDGTVNVAAQAGSMAWISGASSDVSIKPGGMIVTTMASHPGGKMDIDGGAFLGGMLMLVPEDAHITVRNGGGLQASNILNSGRIDAYDYALMTDALHLGCSDHARFASHHWTINATSTEQFVGPRVIGGRGSILGNIDVYEGAELYTGSNVMTSYCEIKPNVTGELTVDGNIILHDGARLVLNTDTTLVMTPGKLLHAKKGSRIDIVLGARNAITEGVDQTLLSVFSVIQSDWLIIHEAEINVFGLDGTSCLPTVNFDLDINAGLDAVLPQTTGCQRGGGFAII